MNLRHVLERLFGRKADSEGTGSHEGVVERQAFLAPLLRLDQQLRLKLLLRFLQILTGDAQYVLERDLR